MSGGSVLWNVGGVLVGALVTWLVSRWYYVRAARDLSKETAELHRLTTLVLRGLEEGGIVELARNPQGEITGLKLYLSATISARAEATATLDVIRPSDSRQ